MSILGIGVFSGVVITKVEATKSDAGQALNITFKKAGEAGAQDNLDFLNSGEISSSDEGKENNIRLYGVSVDDYNKDPKTGDVILNDVLAKKDQLVHIASAFMTSDKIKFDLTKGLGVKDKAELIKKITSEATLEKMNDNLFSQFTGLMTGVVGEDSKRLVVKFLRKSKASNFPRLADRKLDWNPFIAAEDDKALVAKLTFSKWEKDNGFDSNAQSLEESDATAEDLAAQTSAVNSVFND